MARVAERLSDKRVLKLIRAFLNAGVVRPVDEGTPQGGPLSPLLTTSCLTTSTRNRAGLVAGFAATRTAVTSMFAAASQMNGSWLP